MTASSPVGYHESSLLRVVLVLAVLLALPLPSRAAEPASPIHPEIDAYLAKAYPAGEPGATVLASLDGKTVHRSAYGLAHVELSVPLTPSHVLRLGSITKQFSAVALMMLVDEGKVSLDDEITRFLPDYPTRGKTILIEQLLNHTSGIQSYTNLPEWRPLMRKDMTLDELIDFFKDRPMNFEPGTRFLYNNSGYVLVGAVIEKAGGMSYEKFLRTRIFDPLGMEASHSDDNAKCIPRRVAGYRNSASGYIPADFLSMTQPYAAGALLSSVDDLARWNEAIRAGKLLTEESWKRVFSPTELPGGKTESYGYGFAFSNLGEHRVIGHGGGINGFRTHALSVPERELYVAVLTNCGGRNPDPSSVARRIAGMLLERKQNGNALRGKRRSGPSRSGQESK